MTPFGPAVWAYAVGLSTNPEVTSRITEWQPTTIRDGTGILFFASVAAVVVLIARSGRAVPWPTLAWLGVFAAIGLYAQRGLAWWALAAAVAGHRPAPATAPIAPEPATPPMMRRLNVVVAARLVLAGVALLPIWRPSDPGRGPRRRADRCAARRDGRPPRPDATRRPRVQPAALGLMVRVRGAGGQGGPRLTDRVLPGRGLGRLRTGGGRCAGWEERLATWDVAIVVVQATDSAFRDRLIAAGWPETYRDPDGAIFISEATNVGDSSRFPEGSESGSRHRYRRHPPTC